MNVYSVIRRGSFLIILSVIPILFGKRHKGARIRGRRINENKYLSEVDSLIRELNLKNDIDGKIKLII